MRELNVQEVNEISGGDVDWGAVGAGIGSVALGVGVAATPVGWVGAAGAATFSFGGGLAIGYGLSEMNDDRQFPFLP
ncbi:MAG: hypothetical protein HLX50_01230 [Alteromonadaceae bacterium]|nr:hypothetical protein [Alteromonadaceae bacterium]